MFLTQRTEYGLRLLMLLAMERGDDPVAVPDAARRLGVSSHHLAKVAQDLAGLELVETSRGRRGGLRLATGAHERRLGEIVAALEPMPLAECFDGGRGGCVLAPACRLVDVLAQAGSAFIAVLDRHTLADLVLRPHRLRRLLLV